MHKEFLNTYDEVHSLWYGFSDAIKWIHDPGDACYEESKAEPHYYRLGYLAGGVLKASFWYFLGLLSYKVILYAV